MLIRRYCSTLFALICAVVSIPAHSQTTSPGPGYTQTIEKEFEVPGGLVILKGLQIFPYTSQSVKIVGSAVNRTGTNFNVVNFNLKLLDKSGSVLITQTISVSDLKAGADKPIGISGTGEFVYLRTEVSKINTIDLTLNRAVAATLVTSEAKMPTSDTNRESAPPETKKSTAVAIRPASIKRLDDGNMLAALAKTHQQKFASEITDKSIFEREFTVRVHLSEGDLAGITFDDSKQEISFSAGQGVITGGIFFKDHCTKTGSGAGSTALGVKLQYIKQTCERVIAYDKSEFQPGDQVCRPLLYGAQGQRCTRPLVTFPASPSDFRLIKSKGLVSDIRMKLVRGNEAVFTFEEQVRPASLDHLAETRIKAWTTNVSVLGVAWVLPGGNTVVRIDERTVP